MRRASNPTHGVAIKSTLTGRKDFIFVTVALSEHLVIGAENSVPFFFFLVLFSSFTYAQVAELADAPDLGSGTLRCGGSSPSLRTTHRQAAAEMLAAFSLFSTEATNARWDLNQEAARQRRRPNKNSTSLLAHSFFREAGSLPRFLGKAQKAHPQLPRALRRMLVAFGGAGRASWLRHFGGLACEGFS